MENRIRVFLVDGHPIVLLGLSRCFGAHGELEVVGQATSGEEALSQIPGAAPDLVLLDILLPGLNGIEVARVLADRHPGVKVLFLTEMNTQEATRLLVGSRASGCLSKALSTHDLVDRVCEAVRGYGSRAPLGATATSTLPEPRNLSPRERQVLALLADGNSNKQIAAELGLSARTIEKHRAHVMTKLGLKSVALLTKYAVAQGISGPL